MPLIFVLYLIASTGWEQLDVITFITKNASRKDRIFLCIVGQKLVDNDNPVICLFSCSLCLSPLVWKCYLTESNLFLPTACKKRNVFLHTLWLSCIKFTATLFRLAGWVYHHNVISIVHCTRDGPSNTISTLPCLMSSTGHGWSHNVGRRAAHCMASCLEPNHNHKWSWQMLQCQETRLNQNGLQWMLPSMLCYWLQVEVRMKQEPKYYHLA